MPDPAAEGLSAAAMLGLGFLLGLRHALDVDHLAAVWAIASAHPSMRDSARVGLFWGAGHSAALLGAGILLVALGVEVGPGVARALEAGVAAVLVFLGGQVLLHVLRGNRLHAHTHRHGRRVHWHPHFHAGAPDAAGHGHHHAGRIGVRPLLVGFLHGGAGSAALTLILLPTIASPWLALAYIAMFGLGSIGGMVAMSLLVSLPMRARVRQPARLQTAIRAAAGAFSVAVGCLMAWEIGVPWKT